MKPFKNLVFICIALFCLNAYGEGLSSADKKQTVSDIIELLNQHYVHPDVADSIGPKLKRAVEDGIFSGSQTHAEFALDLTKWLIEFTDDKHLKVNSDPSASSKGEHSLREKIARRILKSDATKNAENPVTSVKRLPSNIGYIALNSFPPIEDSKEFIDSGIKLIDGTEALIIDLRENQGGSPEAVQYFSSYFFKPKLLLNEIRYRHEVDSKKFYTLESVGSPKQTSTRLYVVTSNQTFSGAEEFSYNVKVHNRGTIVGETTKGGANPGGIFPVNKNFRMFIPQGEAINPVTGGNWESVGVTPEIKVPAKKALSVAINLAKQDISIQREKTNALRTNQLNQLYDLIDELKETQLPYSKVQKNFKRKISRLTTELKFDRYPFVELGYKNLKSYPLASALIFEISTNVYPNSGYLYDFCAQALINANEFNQTKLILQKGLENVNTPADKEKLTVRLEAVDELINSRGD